MPLKTKDWFQSSPTPEGGRYQSMALIVDEQGRVSILAHPGGRALQLLYKRDYWDAAFQSSPTPEGGRYLATPCRPKAAKLFQSSPTPEGGRYNCQKCIQKALYQFQSSPTPEGGRYTYR